MHSEPNLLWVTGAGGLIGSHIVRALSRNGTRWKPVALTRPDLDLLDSASVERRFRKDRPKAVIHCAAMSKSPACQASPELAWKTNVDATRCLAELGSNIPFIFFSTDLVFDGGKGNYTESDAVNPLSVYGETKVAAEKIVLRNPRHTVIRISLAAGKSPTGDRSFTEEIRRAWQRGEKLKLFRDEYRCPIGATIVAQATCELLQANKPDLYHLCGSQRLSRVEIGTLLAAVWPDLHPQFDSVSLAEYRGAPRAPDVSMNCAKLQKLLPFPLPAFSDWIQAHRDEMA